MRNYSIKQHYIFLPQLVFRTPLLPFTLHNKYHESNVSLKLIFSRKDIQEAIFLASPIIYKQCERWLKNELSGAKEIEKLTHTLYKYYIRMQTRCTPYGLFAGCGVGNWGKKNHVLISDTSRHTRLDMDYLCGLPRLLERDKVLKQSLNYFPNNSIYAIGEQLRYVEHKYVNDKRIYQIVSVDNNEYLKKILKFSENGASISKLIEILVNDGIEKEEASRYVDDLVGAQLFISELEPNITGIEYSHQLLKRLIALNARIKSSNIEIAIDSLRNLLSEMEAIDGKIGNDIKVYQKIIDDLTPLSSVVNPKVLFQTDLFRKTQHSSLNISIQDELYKCIDFLNKITPVAAQVNLERFITNYLARYEDVEMPLLHVLDSENGIGYLGRDNEGVNALLDGVFINGDSNSDYSIKVNDTQAVLFRKLLEAQSANQYIIKLRETDFKNIDFSSDALPPTMYVFYKIIDAHTNKILFKHCSGSSGINLIGRFAHGNGDIHTIASTLSKHEEELHPDKIFAEIVHLPQDRTGNILMRPIFRDYEIPYLAASAVDKEHQINLKDLFIKVVDHKVVLTSRKLNKEIIPRLGNAHNFSFNALPVYQFLCDLQDQYHVKSWFNFAWGDFSNLFPFTPRVEYSNSVLIPATWNFFKNDFNEILEIDMTNFDVGIKQWRKKWNLPSLVCLEQEDNDLLVDLENEFSIKVFTNLIKNKKAIKMTEFLFEGNTALVSDANNNVYTNECIAFLLCNKGGSAENNNLSYRSIEAFNKQNVKRKFVLGDEWLFYKIYCGVKTADKILVNIIEPLISRLTKDKLIRNWFFIRFTDPEFHIRLRLRLTDINAIGAVINTINAYLKVYIEQDLINKLLADTYNREVERYGQSSMEVSEQFFEVDSSKTIEMLIIIKQYDDENIRWLYALKCIDDLLDSFSFSISQKKKLLGTLSASFFSEHKGSKDLKIQLDAKYRNYQKMVEKFLCAVEIDKYLYSNVYELLNRKKLLVNEIADKIKGLMNTEALEPDIYSLLSSYIHMMLNRIFVGSPRSNELVLYHVLNKYYESKIARSKIKTQ